MTMSRTPGRLSALAAALMAASCIATPAAKPPAEIPTVAPAAAWPVTPAGDWHGVLVVNPPGATYRLGLSIEEAAPGQFRGTIASPDQGRSGTPLEDMSFAGGIFSFRIPTVRASYSGKWDEAEKAWLGDYTTAASAKFPLRFSAGVVPPLPPLPAVAGLDGRWEGKIQGVMPIVVRIKTDELGTLAWMDSPSQQSVNLPIPTLARDGARVSFAMPNLAIAYEGDLAASGDKIAGTFTQAGQSIPFELAHVSADTAPAILKPRPQTPQKPYPYREEEVVIDNPAAPGLRLACTLTTPNASAHHPAAILITGSGAQDRDETLLGHKPFLVLADHLTRQGLAVLRCDDRDLTRPSTEPMGSLIEEFTTDVKAQLAFLRTRADIDPKRIGLIGHSEGGVTGPRVAAEDPEVAFLVTLAGVGVKGRDALLEQRVLLTQSMGGTPEQIAFSRDLFATLFDELLAAADDAAAKAAAVKAFSKPVPGAPATTPEAIDQVATMFASAYYRDLLAYDPAPVLAKITIPVLSINGSKDVQVEARQNLGGYRASLNHNPDFTAVELPGLNHLFQTSTTGAVTEYADIDETFSPAALQVISDWIVKRMKP